MEIGCDARARARFERCVVELTITCHKILIIVHFIITLFIHEGKILICAGNKFTCLIL